ncbi:MAG: hypothetical protein RIC24_04180 [Hyphomicrobiales bacterium]|jgi:hypothetical protein
MPLQNRVHPTGTLHGVSARGDMMGNRGGRFHDPLAKAILGQRRWASRAWITCVLCFKGRQRKVWGNSYTELFFLDEVTALSAGHRPCFECRRADAKRFQAALFAGMKEEMGWTNPPNAIAMDRLLHEARLKPAPRTSRIGDVPIGAMVDLKREILAIGPRGLLPWSFDGYGQPSDISPETQALLITPTPMIAALNAGYAPSWHNSAGAS